VGKLARALIERPSAAKERKPMLKTIAWISLGAALCSSPSAAIAQTGYGVTPGAPSTSTFDRSWNRANESKERARAGAAYVRHGAGYHHPHHPYAK
jgi:hypothetical protein